MLETAEDLAWLQEVVDLSAARAGAFLRESFRIPSCTLSAGQLARHLVGIRTVALSTVTPGGEPRVAPIGALFSHGRYHVPTVEAARRTRNLRQRPAVSLTEFEGVDLAVIVHGRAEILGPDHPDFASLDALQREHGGQSPREWGTGVYLRIEPDLMFSFAREPERFPG